MRIIKKTIQYRCALLKNDAIFSARSQVRGHKNTKISSYLGCARNNLGTRCDIIKNDAISMRNIKKRCKSMLLLKNDAISMRIIKKRYNIDAHY
jgi:hypothetical protein